MTRWIDIFEGLQNRNRATLYEGRIARNATGLDDPVPVVVRAFDRSMDWPESPWMPRFTVEGGEFEVQLPAYGDRCVVAIAETEDPGEPEIWIVAWWPSA